MQAERDLTHAEYLAALRRRGWRQWGTQVVVPGGAAEVVIVGGTIRRRATIGAAWREADRADVERTRLSSPGGLEE